MFGKEDDIAGQQNPHEHSDCLDQMTTHYDENYLEPKTSLGF